MNDQNAVGNYYCIAHVAQFTGLTDRTIRSYISMGLLEGEKINGLWHFTPEQVDAFVRHPTVRPSIQAKRNALIYDFLRERQKDAHRTCMILDFPGEDEKAITDFFCYAIGEYDLHDFAFSYDHVEGEPRAILRGRTDEVLKLVNAYYAQRES